MVYAVTSPEKTGEAAREIFEMITRFSGSETAFQSAKNALISQLRMERTGCGKSIW
jgi:hypothetical protein